MNGEDEDSSSDTRLRKTAPSILEAEGTMLTELTYIMDDATHRSRCVSGQPSLMFGKDGHKKHLRQAYTLVSAVGTVPFDPSSGSAN